MGPLQTTILAVLSPETKRGWGTFLFLHYSFSGAMYAGVPGTYTPVVLDAMSNDLALVSPRSQKQVC